MSEKSTRQKNYRPPVVLSMAVEDVEILLAKTYRKMAIAWGDAAVQVRGETVKDPQTSAGR
jgi:hypothetical protein